MKIGKYKIEIAVFICGALGMALELVAARVLSPYVGSSNLIWTTIIGIMLISMSLGYAIGGRLADKKSNINVMAMLILIGAVFTSFISIEETLIVKNFSEVMNNNLVLVAIITALIVFGIPSFIIATISPYAVKLKDQEHENIGKLSGKISSISTIGSIVGTFLTGFYLIPTFGVRTIIMFIAILLFVLAAILYKKTDIKIWITGTIIFILIIGINALGYISFSMENTDIVEDVDSEYSRIWVKDIVGASGTNYKTLQVDTGLESYIDKDTGELQSEYLKYYDLFEYYKKDAKSTLMIGGAAYVYPSHYLKKFENKTIDVVEIDSTMTKIAEENFNLDSNNPRFKNYTQDGRSFLNYTENKYDCILLDAFKGVNAPFELTTYEAMVNAKNALNENGIILTNIISALDGKDSDFIKYEYNTYKAVFEDVKLFKVNNVDDETRQNLILVGIKGNSNINDDKYEEYEKFINREITDFSSDKQIVTDDYAPIGN